MSRLPTWLLTAPILVVGLFAGHDAGYRLAHPDSGERARALGQAGHDYFALAPYGVAVVLAVVCLALALRVRGALSGRRGGTPPWAFALASPIAFVALEAMERLRADQLGHMHSRQVLVGLALQLPFALAALLVARLLGSVADAVATGLGPVLHVVLRPLGASVVPVAADTPRVRMIALAYGERGPPVLS